MILWLLYALIQRNKKLALLHLVTLIGRFIWMILASAILRYGVGIIMRTALTVASLFATMIKDAKKDTNSRFLVYVALWIFILRWVIQLMLNLVRISSQWGQYNFVWYKWNQASDALMAYSTDVIETLEQDGIINASDIIGKYQQASYVYGVYQNENTNKKIVRYFPLYNALSLQKKEQVWWLIGQYTNAKKIKDTRQMRDINKQIRTVLGTRVAIDDFISVRSQLGQNNKGTVDIIELLLRKKATYKKLFYVFPYNAQDVFNVQFSHYNPFLQEVENRRNEDGILVAGTYIEYFLNNHNYLKRDGMLSRLAKLWSDQDLCKFALRLQDSNINYLVIDPNIGTVVMGAGNQSLFDRFFAKINPSSGRIEEKWAITMLVDMVQAWYAELFYSNNLGAKYAYELIWWGIACCGTSMREWPNKSVPGANNEGWYDSI